MSLHTRADSDVTVTGEQVQLAIQPVPQGALLLHIGVPKTGTTALQDSVAAARDGLGPAGVTYPGQLAEHNRAALALLGTTWGWRDQGGIQLRTRWWHELLHDIRSAPGRVLVSSEFFCEADDEQTAAIVSALGSERLHVAVTLRPLGRLLASSWQQYLKYGVARNYTAWLRAVLADPPKHRVTPSFWRRHDHGTVVQRWVDAVGPDRVTVIVLDRTNHSFLPRTFERLLALPEGMLAPQPQSRSNRSLTLAEAELLRLVNREVRELGMGWRSYEKLLRKGAVLRMVEQRTPDADEPRIVTPDWALERAAELGRESVTRLRASGARVLGDLESLASDHGRPGEPERADLVPVRAAAQALVGAAMAGVPEPAPDGEGVPLERRVVKDLTAGELAQVLRDRARGRLKGRRT